MTGRKTTRSKTTHDLVAIILKQKIVGKISGKPWTAAEKKATLALFDSVHSMEMNDEFHRGRHYYPPG